LTPPAAAAKTGQNRAKSGAMFDSFRAVFIFNDFNEKQNLICPAPPRARTFPRRFRSSRSFNRKAFGGVEAGVPPHFGRVSPRGASHGMEDAGGWNGVAGRNHERL